MQGLHAIQQIYTPSLCVSLDLSTEIWQLLVTAMGSASSYALLKQSKPSALNFIPINENKSLSNAVSDVTPLLTDERLLGHFWFVQVYTIVSFCRQQRSSDYLIQKHQQLWVRAREDLRLLESLPRASTTKPHLLLPAVALASCPHKITSPLTEISSSWGAEGWKN